MAEEMMLESMAWESDEAVEDIEADEALAEAEESVEDIGERVRSRGRGGPRRPLPMARGVRGMVVRGQDGRPRNMPFPTKLATAQETNRGLATQEVRRRAVEERLDKLEARFRLQQKKDSSISGVVTLAVGVPLTAWGLFKAPAAGGSRFETWSNETTTKSAAVVAATQLAKTGAKLLINGRYHRSGVGLAADVFAGAQLLTFAFAYMYKEAEYQPEKNHAAALTNIGKYKKFDLIVAQDTGEVYVVDGPANNLFLRKMLRH